jgi:hypothetical protein
LLSEGGTNVAPQAAVLTRDGDAAVGNGSGGADGGGRRGGGGKTVIRRPNTPDPDALVPVVKEKHEKIGRNEPCWCGSGKKFKLCHGAA